MGKKIKEKLTPKQELFCKIYATDRDCFGNGVQAYLEVFNTEKKPVTYKSARVLAYRLLTKVNICNKIRELLDIYISNEVVDKELGQVILQYGDLSSKVAAVREYNKVKSRVKEPERKDPEVTVNINITGGEADNAKKRIKNKKGISK